MAAQADQDSLQKLHELASQEAAKLIPNTGLSKSRVLNPVHCLMETGLQNYPGESLPMILWVKKVPICKTIPSKKTKQNRNTTLGN